MTGARNTSARAISMSWRWAVERLPARSDGSICDPTPRPTKTSAAFRAALAREYKSAGPGSLPRKIFSATLRSGAIINSWKIVTMPCCRASRGLSNTVGRPSISIEPLSGFTSPERMRMSVDFPAPFSPTSAWTSPRRRSSETPCSARTPGKSFTRLFSVTRGIPPFAGADVADAGPTRGTANALLPWVECGRRPRPRATFRSSAVTRTPAPRCWPAAFRKT